MNYYVATATFYIPWGDEEHNILLTREDIPHLRNYITEYYKPSALDLYTKFSSGCKDEIDPEIELEWMEEILEESEENGDTFEQIVSKIIEWYFCAIQVSEATEEDLKFHVCS